MSKGPCVFVVDDDPSARKGLTRLLRTASYDVREFESAEEFLDGLGVSVAPTDYGLDQQEWLELIRAAFDGERGRNYIGRPAIIMSHV